MTGEPPYLVQQGEAQTALVGALFASLPRDGWNSCTVDYRKVGRVAESQVSPSARVDHPRRVPGPDRRWRSEEVESWLSLSENGAVPGPPVVHQAMTNRLGGLVVEQIRSDDYVPPLILPQFSYVIAKLRELSVMWAFGSEAWPRARISENIGAVKYQVADFMAPGVLAGNGLDDVPH